MLGVVTRIQELSRAIRCRCRLDLKRTPCSTDIVWTIWHQWLRPDVNNRARALGIREVLSIAAATDSLPVELDMQLVADVERHRYLNRVPNRAVCGQSWDARIEGIEVRGAGVDVAQHQDVVGVVHEGYPAILVNVSVTRISEAPAFGQVPRGQVHTVVGVEKLLVHVACITVLLVFGK